MWAILNGAKFSVGHLVTLHMYRIVSKNKGQLPYGSLIFRIFQHLGLRLRELLTSVQHTIMHVD